MHYVISFETSIFDLDSERENSINPIKGLSVAEWFKPRFLEKGIEVGEIDEEDWGWYSIAKYQGNSYLLGFIAFPDEKGVENPEIIVQVDKERTIFEKLLGKNKMEYSDKVIAAVKSIISSTPDFNKVEEIA